MKCLICKKQPADAVCWICMVACIGIGVLMAWTAAVIVGGLR